MRYDLGQNGIRLILISGGNSKVEEKEKKGKVYMEPKQTLNNHSHLEKEKQVGGITTL